MQTYKFDTRISEVGMIDMSVMPAMPSALYNSEVQLVIKQKKPKVVAERKEEDEYAASDFLKKWAGAFSDEGDTVVDENEEILKEYGAEPASEFLREYTERLEAMTEEEAEAFKEENWGLEFLRKCAAAPDKAEEPKSLKDYLRYEYLNKKYDVNGRYSDEEVDEARYQFLKEKYK